MSEQQNSSILRSTSDIVSAYVASHEVAVQDIPTLVQQVHKALLSTVADQASVARAKLKPAVPVDQSVQQDYIVCLEDGVKLQMLKRHLKTKYGMTVEEYKERWGLGTDYPSVSPSYAERRSAIAKTSGLGLKGRRKKVDISSRLSNKEKEDGKVSQMAIVAGG